MGFGPVAPEADEPLFHAEWEERALGVMLCASALGHWNIDESRHSREDRHPVDYYSSSYYELWQKGLERLLMKHDVVTAEELAAGRPLAPGPAEPRILTADRVADSLRRGTPYERSPDAEPRFRPGDRVRARVLNPPTHTRLPRYTRGRIGVVEANHGCHVFPDTNAHGEGEQPQWLYTIRFDGTELWGDDAEPGLTVSIDAWEPYLEPVEAADPVTGVIGITGGDSR